MVPDALALSPATTLSADVLRWIARRHRTIIVMTGMAAGSTGKWAHILTLPDAHEALGLQPSTAAKLSADDILRAGRSSTLQRLIDRRASIGSEQTPWIVGIRGLCRSLYSPVATVRAGSVGRVDVADWMGTMRLVTDQSRRLIRLRSERGRYGLRIQADDVVRSIDCTVDGRNLLMAIIDCQAESVTLAIDRRSILRIAPAGANAGTRAVYLLAAAPAAIAT